MSKRKKPTERVRRKTLQAGLRNRDCADADTQRDASEPTSKAQSYEVGYSKPPIEHRFKKGQPSPNPCGRPKRERMGLRAAFEEALGEKIPIHENGRKSRIPASLAFAKGTVVQALTGGTTEKRLLLKAAQDLKVDLGPSPPAATPAAQANPGVIILLPHNERDMIDWRARAKAIENRPDLKKYYEMYLRAAEVDEAAEALIPPDQRPKKIK